MKKNDYKEITIYELNLLYLELKYCRVSSATYGSYQDRGKIINEYFGNYKVKDITSSLIDDFYNYLKYDRKWSYTTKISDKIINIIMKYLYSLIKQAIFWHIIPENSISSKEHHVKLKQISKSEQFIREKNELLLNIEYKRVSEKMNMVFSNSKLF